jgi:pimeloyl-ACP methyl ester carboxylesterase
MRASPAGGRYDVTTQSLRVAVNGIELDVVAAGPPDGPLAILLHGFPEFSYGWRHQIPALAAAGLRVVAPDQRGYNRSDKPAGTAAYKLDTLADDVLGLAKALGHERFVVVGHDWGGVVAWHLAARNSERISRAAILNAPHPGTMRRYARSHPSQALKSWYVAFFQVPVIPEQALRAAGFWGLRRALCRTSRRRHLQRRRFPALSRSLERARRAHRHAELVSRTSPLGIFDARRAHPGAGAGDLGRPRRLSRFRPRRSRHRAVRRCRRLPPAGCQPLGPA